MNIQNVILTLHQMQSDGIVGRCAIGGAVGATFYLEQAIEMDVEGASVRVFTAKHLAAIALQTGRAKDKSRLLQFLESGTLSSDRFQEIITRHGLEAAWTRFSRQFLSDDE